MIIKILAEGGNMVPGPALSQKLGPAGVNVNQVIQKVNEATKDFKGLKVPTELDINTSTKEIQVRIFSPPVSELVKKELGLERGSGAQKTILAGNVIIETGTEEALKTLEKREQEAQEKAEELQKQQQSLYANLNTLGQIINKAQKARQEQEQND